MEEFQFKYKEPTDIPSNGNTNTPSGNTNVPDKNGAVQTGDTANPIWLVGIVAALLAITGNLFYKKQRKN